MAYGFYFLKKCILYIGHFLRITRRKSGLQPTVDLQKESAGLMLLNVLCLTFIS